MTCKSNKVENIISSMASAWSRYRGKAFSLCDDLVKRQVELVKQILDLSKLQKGALIVLKGPTGSGKTEVFVTPFLYSFYYHQPIAPRMYLVEPMHALISNFKERLNVYINALALDNELAIGEDHGSVTTKTFLYTAPITITTVDSYAYGYLAKRVETFKQGDAITGRFTMPAGLQALSYTVFDEAHLIQDEAFVGPRVMSRIIASLTCSGSIVVLSSATLPIAVLDEYKNTVKEFCGDSVDEGDLVYEKEMDVKARRVVEIEFKQKKIVESIEEDLNCDEKALVIVNTIERALDIYERVKRKCRGNVVLLHSLVKVGDRLQKCTELLKLTRGKEGYIAIGTQTLEVGLDLDFNVLYTELAPIDALIQRMGRICRVPHQQCRVYIYDPPSEAPYTSSLMQNTKNVIQRYSKLNLFDIRKVQQLVDSVYNTNVVNELEERGTKLYIDVVDYMNRLYLLSLPPEKEVYIRPSFYVTVALLEKSGLNYATENSAKCLLDDLKHHEIRISVPLAIEGMVGCSRLIALLNAVLRCNGTVYRLVEVESRDGIDVAVLKNVTEGLKKRLEASGNVTRVCRNLEGEYLVLALDPDCLSQLYSYELGLDVRTLKAEPVSKGPPVAVGRPKHRAKREGGRKTRKSGVA